jgi:hypothetical protein
MLEYLLYGVLVLSFIVMLAKISKMPVTLLARCLKDISYFVIAYLIFRAIYGA